MSVAKQEKFQSTPPVKAATRLAIRRAAEMQISIHAAREGGDLLRVRSPQFLVDFNPRRP